MDYRSIGVTHREIDALYNPTFGLGCSPAEEQGSPEVREFSWADHDATAELRLWEDS